MNNHLLKLAQEKYSIKNLIYDNEYYEPMEDFLLKLYIRCDPASYGKKFTKKLKLDAYDKNYDFSNICDSGDSGDILMSFKYFINSCELGFKVITYARGTKTKIVPIYKLDNIPFKKIEVKISYLGISDNYSIKNIRPYQDFDYFLLCFVDCTDNFKQIFVLVNKIFITENINITLTPEHGTKKTNEHNKKMGYGTCFDKNSHKFEYIKENNLLKGTNYSDVIDFFENESISLKNQFNNKIIKPINIEH